MEREIVADLKERAREAATARRSDLAGLAQDIHDHPELAFAEEYAAARLTEFLAAEGFTVRKGLCGMPTAFVATFGTGPLHVAFCAEYDALPPSSLFAGLTPSEVAELWQSVDGSEGPLAHGCGHNLIAGAAVAAAMALRDVAEEAGLTVSVFGTPGEELIGLKDPPTGHLAAGKVRLFEGGAFEGVDVILMVHPGPTPFGMIAPSKAGLRLRAHFSEAGPGPTRPFGPAEARRLDRALRRTLRPLGQAPYFCVVLPESEAAGARAELFYAGHSLRGVLALRGALRRCFQEAAASTGRHVDIAEYAPSDAMRQDPLLSASYRSNWQALCGAREQDPHVQEEMCEVVPFGPRVFKRWILRRMGHALFLDKLPANVLWGSDLGSASQSIPAIQPFIGIGGMAAAHTLQFAAQAESDEAYEAMLKGGVAMAWTALDAATDPDLKDYLLRMATTRKETVSTI